MLRREFCRDHCKYYRAKFNDRKNWICGCVKRETFVPGLNIYGTTYSNLTVFTSSDVPDDCPYSLEHLYETEYRIEDGKE